MQPLVAILLAMAALRSGLAQTDGQALLYQCLGETGAEVVPPHDPAYARASKVFMSRYDSVLPTAVVYANSTEDVQQAVKCAQLFSVPLLPRGGGHSTIGASLRQGAVTLDLSRMSQVEVALSWESATVGAGAVLGQVYYTVAKATQGTKGFPAGTCPNVGVGGHILGGGIGHLTRKYGLACDQLISLTMVDAAGEVVVADATQNQDLLWASCGGGGGTFGIVTQYTLRLVGVPPLVTTWHAEAPNSQGADVLEWYQEWAPQLPRDLSVILMVQGNVTIFTGQFQGPAAEAQRVLNETGATRPPFDWLSYSLQETDWIWAGILAQPWPVSTPAQFANPEAFWKFRVANKSKARNFLEPLPREALQAIIDYVAGTPGSYSYIQALGGAMRDFSPNATAYPWRDAIMNVFWAAVWDPKLGPSPEMVASISELEGALAQHSQAAYVNYMDPDLANWPRAYWGENVGRLVEVKRRYDPQGFFWGTQVLSPSTVVLFEKLRQAPLGSGEQQGPQPALQLRQLGIVTCCQMTPPENQE